MYTISRIDEELLSLNIPKDIVEEVVGESIFHGEPYLLLCRRCRSIYTVCFFIQVSPVDVNAYSALLKGLLISVPSSKELDTELEELFRRADTIVSRQGVVSFYIPRNYTGIVYKYLCREGDWRDREVKVLDPVEALIYIGEGDSN